MVDSMAESIEIGWINQITCKANLANCPWFAKPKPPKLVLTINNLLAYVLIRQTFSPNARKESICQTFSLTSDKSQSSFVTNAKTVFKETKVFLPDITLYGLKLLWFQISNTHALATLLSLAAWNSISFLSGFYSRS